METQEQIPALQASMEAGSALRNKYLGILKYYCKGTPSASGLRVADLLERWNGLHHFDEATLKKVDWTHDRHQVIKLSRYDQPGGGLASFDFNMLTTLVFLAHDLCIRVDLHPVNPQFIQLICHPRHSRDGDFSQRHPTIEQVLESWRSEHPVSGIFAPTLSQQEAAHRAMMHRIPDITDPQGRYWDQPPRELIEVDATHALMSAGTLGELHEYSTSIPTGTYVGKMWSCHCRDGSWLLRWYDRIEAENITIESRKVLVVDHAPSKAGA